jgi:hypothetical protein
VFWAAQSVSGWHADNREHHQPAESYPNYLTTGHFVEATAENWESEFLQMSGYVFLTAFLRQRGSPGCLVLTVYEHSFALTLFAIFLACFAVHAAGARRSSTRNSWPTASRRFRLVGS